MIHTAVLATRRSRTPAIALIKLIGLAVIVIEFIFIQVDLWHPWPKRETKFLISQSVGGDEDMKWSDGSIVGCASAYQSYPSKSWHLDVFLGKAWFARVKIFDVATKGEVLNIAGRWCKP